MKAFLMIALYFTGNGESGVHMASTEDGWTWHPEVSSIIKPPPGVLMRDPHLTKFKDQAVLVFTTGWWTNDFGIATTTNLRNWSEIRRIPAMKETPGTLNVWAPESVVDPKTGDLIVFWSSTVEGKYKETERTDGDVDAQRRPLNHRFYYTTTSDLKEFSPPKLLWDPGFNCIDATMIQFKGQWVMIGKDETKAPVPCKRLFVATAPHPLGPWKMLKRDITAADHWAEGPSAIVVDGKIRVFYDRYMDNRWGIIESANLTDWIDVSARLKFVPGARHGVIIDSP